MDKWRELSRWKRWTLIGVGAFLLLGIIGSVTEPDKKVVTVAASQSVPSTVRATALPTTLSTLPPSTVAPTAAVRPTTTVVVATTVATTTTAPPVSLAMPDVRGKNLQIAADQLEALGLTVISHDSTGRGRTPLLYSNWSVTTQDPAPGKKITLPTTVDLGAKKFGE
jgi:hypothetical protein